MENEIKNIFDNILKSQKDKTFNKHKDVLFELVDSIDLKKPDIFYFNNKYETENLHELALETKLENITCENEDFFILIYLNYSDLEEYLSNIFRKELGFTCSVDKARFVLRNIMKKQMTGYASLRDKGDFRSISNPFYKRFSDWEKLVKTCPIIIQNKYEEHAHVLLKIVNQFRASKKQKKEFIFSFKNWLLDTEYKAEKIVINEKEYDYERIFKQDPINAYEYLKRNSPYILKVYKRTCLKLNKEGL